MTPMGVVLMVSAALLTLAAVLVVVVPFAWRRLAARKPAVAAAA